MRDTAAQLARYLLTGGAAAVVDLGGFSVLLRLGLPIAAAATLSFCVAALVNYALTARFVFGTGASARGFGLFFAVALVGLAINVGVTVLLSAQSGLLPELAKVGGIAVAFLANFAMNKLIVFRR
jgi:putative flippase GtrA